MVPHVATEVPDEGHQWNSDPTFLVIRTPESIRKKSAQIHMAVRQTSSEVIVWMQQGSLWRTVFVSSVSVILLLGFAGLGTFILFLLAATLNAVAIGFLASVAAVGAFTALFFSILISIYIGALVIAVFVISTVTFFCICAALTVAGWIAFLWVLWQGLKRGYDVLKSYFGSGATKLPSFISIDGQKYREQIHEKKEC